MTNLRAASALLLLSALSSACTPLATASFGDIKNAFRSGALTVDEKQLQPGIAYLRVKAPGSEAIMARRFSDSGRETWYSASGQVLTLSQGLIINSVGMPHDISDLRVDLTGQGNALAAATLPVSYQKLIDRLPDQANEVTTYRLQDKGTERVTAWGRVVSTRRLQEVVTHSNSATPLPGNTYWLAAETGELVQSRQWLAPDFPLVLQPRQPTGRLAATTDVDGVEKMSPVPVAGAAATTLIVTAPIRLNVLMRNFPLPDQSYAPATALLSRSAIPAQQLQKKRLLFDLDEALANKKTPPLLSQRAELLRASIAAMPVTGRIPLLQTNARWLQANPGQDPLLNGGDKLHRLLHRPSQAQVFQGQLNTGCPVAVDPKQTVINALKACLSAAGWFGASLPDTVYLINANGRVQSVDVALWNRAPAMVVLPGTQIWVPIAGLAHWTANPGFDFDIANWLSTQVINASAESVQP